MDFTFSEIQEELRKQARDWTRERWPLERAQEAQYDPSTWQELAELGWLGVSVPEEQGGAGLTFLEEAVLFEEMGRVLYPGPYFATVGLALPALPAHELEHVAAGNTRWSAAVGGLVVDPDKVDAVAGSESVPKAEE